MYRKIDRDNIQPGGYRYLGLERQKAKQQANHYLANNAIYDTLRKTYLRGEITKQQLLTLRGQVRSGDADGAWKGLERLVMKGAQS